MDQQRRFRQYCRWFYLHSTSIVSEESSLHRNDDDDDNNDNDNDNNNKFQQSRLILEAIDQLLLEQQSHCYNNQTGGNNNNNINTNNARNADNGTRKSSPYRAFLASQTAEDLRVLEVCGFPARETDIATKMSDPYFCTSYAKIRSEERRSVHQIQMVERSQRTLRLLNELCGDDESESNNDDDDDNDDNHNDKIPPVHTDLLKAATPQLLTPQFTTLTTTATTTTLTRQSARQTIQSFVEKYCEISVAFHPLLAGMRKVIEMQLGKHDPSEVKKFAVVWTFDLGAISEAVLPTTKALGSRSGIEGGNDTCIREALETLLSFLVWHRRFRRRCSGDPPPSAVAAAAAPTTITLEVQPFLSDPSLQRLLRVLPRENQLHARATGTIRVGTTARTNVDGVYDDDDDDDDDDDAVGDCAQFLFGQTLGGIMSTLGQHWSP